MSAHGAPRNPARRVKGPDVLLVVEIADSSKRYDVGRRASM